MELKGEYRLRARREAVWAALNDPDILKQCIPGCESLERDGDNRFTAKATNRIGPVKATFTGNVELKDLSPPESYRIEGEGKGGAAGFAKGGAIVKLADDNGDTLLSYDVDAKVGGKLAQLGQRLIDSAAKKMADDFFAAFADIVAPDGNEAIEPEGAAAASSTSSTSIPVVPIAIAALVVVALIIWIFTR